MRLLLLVPAAVVVLALAACGDDDSSGDEANGGAPEAIKVTSPDWKAGRSVPAELSCVASDTAPPPRLRWSGVPAEAAELAITVIDPDAPGGDFGHWGVARVDSDATEPGDPVIGIEVQNDLGTNRYLPPCPPEGDEPHRFVVTVYALGEELGLSGEASVGELDEAARAAAIATGSLTATFGR